MTSINLQEIERLTAKKAKEWKDANCLQISSLTAALEKKESECLQYKEMLIDLKTNFKYNLGLLQQRDKELERYDELIIRAKTTESARLAEISDLRIKIAKLNDSLRREQKEKCDMQRHYRQQLADQQSSVELLKASKEEQLDDVTSQLNEMKYNRERIETQLRAELEAQRFELNVEFDRKFKENIAESKTRVEEMAAGVLAHELKCKFMEKELEHLKETHKKQEELLQEAESNISNLQKQLMESENNANNISTVKNTRILDLEAKVQRLAEQKTRALDEFEEKRKLLDKDMRIKHSNIEVVRKTFSDKERQLEQQISKLRLKAQACEQETKRTLLDMQQLQRNQEGTTETLKRKIEELTIRLENHTESYNTAMAGKHVEIDNLQQKESLMNAEICRLNEKIKRQELDVSEAKQKENLLLQSKVQLKLDLQQKYQEERRQHHDETNHIIENLTKSRDETVAELNILQVQLRNEVGNESGESAITIHKMMELQAQNHQLKDIIEQMSDAMQHAVEHGQGKEYEEESSKLKKEEDQTVSSEYVTSLENQVLHLKKEIRKVQELATINEQHTVHHDVNTKFQSAQPRSDESSDVQKKGSHYKLQEPGTIVHARRQDQYVTRAMNSPSKAAYLLSHLQEKLAKAVSQITLLSREKAQLLEIGNSLKSELGNLRRQGLQNVENYRMEKEDLCDAGYEEKFDDVDRNKLKQLEDLQYQLTKQELQFAQRGKPHKQNLKWVQAHTRSDLSEQPVPTKDRKGGIHAPMNKGDNNLQYSLSSVGDASARNIWGVLDQGMTSPSLPRSDEENDRLHLLHNKPPTHERGRIRSKGRTDRVVKIRNYNIKDDEVARRREDHRR